MKEFKCAECGESHGELYLHGRCHINAPTWAIFRPGHLPDGMGHLEIVCAECGKHIRTFLAIDDEDNKTKPKN